MKPPSDPAPAGRAANVTRQALAQCLLAERAGTRQRPPLGGETPMPSARFIARALLERDGTVCLRGSKQREMKLRARPTKFVSLGAILLF